MIEQIMFFSGGFLVASLLALTLIPVVHSRAVRLTARQFKDSALDPTELQANIDCLRAQFAMATRRLEKRNEQLRVTAATQLSEIGRKTQMINRLKAELAGKTSAADDPADRKTPVPERTAPVCDLETTLSERGLLLDQCDAQIDALFDEIAVIEKEPQQLRKSLALSSTGIAVTSIDGGKSRKATRLRA